MAVLFDSTLHEMAVIFDSTLHRVTGADGGGGSGGLDCIV